MSTVVINAYKLPRSTDMFLLKQALQPIQQKIHAAVMQEELSATVYECDGLAIRGTEFDFLRRFNARLMDEKNSFSAAKKLTGTTAVVFERASTGKRYIVFHGMFDKFSDQIAQTPGIGSEYEYWNNTDQPQHVSNRAWQTRKKVWDDLVNSRSLQTQICTMHFFDGFDASVSVAQQMFHSGEISLPSLEKRSNRAGLDLFLTDRVDSSATDYFPMSIRLTSQWDANKIDQDVKAGYIATAHLQLTGLPAYALRRE